METFYFILKIYNVWKSHIHLSFYFLSFFFYLFRCVLYMCMHAIIGHTHLQKVLSFMQLQVVVNYPIQMPGTECRKSKKYLQFLSHTLSLMVISNKNISCFWRKFSNTSLCTFNNFNSLALMLHMSLVLRIFFVPIVTCYWAPLINKVNNILVYFIVLFLDFS